MGATIHSSCPLNHQNYFSFFFSVGGSVENHTFGSDLGRGLLIVITTIYNYVIFSRWTITFSHHYIPCTVGVTVSGSYSIENQGKGSGKGACPFKE